MIDYLELTIKVRNLDYEDDDEVNLLAEAIQSHINTLTQAETDVIVDYAGEEPQ